MTDKTQEWVEVVREEFETSFEISGEREHWQEKYKFIDTQAKWEGYLAGRKKAEEEIENLREQRTHELNFCGRVNSANEKEIERLKNEIQLMKDEFNDVYLPMHSERIDKRDKLLEQARSFISLYGLLNNLESPAAQQWLRDYEELKNGN